MYPSKLELAIVLLNPLEYQCQNEVRFIIYYRVFLGNIEKIVSSRSSYFEHENVNHLNYTSLLWCYHKN